tara:strand:+ start:1458 stop:2474 length:1017 start_codon:yes stop_codon:yes gene_type:complete
MAAYTTIDNPELYFQCKLYTGNGSDNHAMTFDNTDTSMQPDMVWMKSRTQSGYNHYLVDDVRGVTKALRPNLGNDEDTYSDAFKSFDSNGFTLDDDTSNSEINQNTKTYVAWCWKESATAGFDMVSFSGNETARTISHSLSAVPHWMMIKNRDSNFQWVVYHHKNTSAPETDYLYLSSTDATADFAGHFNDTAPTSSVFTVGTDTGVNKNSQNHMNYLWSEVQGFSKFGTYTGNGNADGVFVYTGFRPAFVITKKTSGTSPWGIHDNKRDPFNEVDELLEADTNAALSDSTYGKDFLSNGFKIRTSSAGVNGDGNTFVYIAFAEAPFVNSNGVPGNAR